MEKWFYYNDLVKSFSGMKHAKPRVIGTEMVEARCLVYKGSG